MNERIQRLTEDDLPYAIVITSDGEIMSLMSLDDIELTQTRAAGLAECKSCGASELLIKLWQFVDRKLDMDTGDWMCGDCILDDANSVKCTDDWYLSVKRR